MEKTKIKGKEYFSEFRRDVNAHLDEVISIFEKEIIGTKLLWRPTAGGDWLERGGLGRRRGNEIIVNWKVSDSQKRKFITAHEFIHWYLDATKKQEEFDALPAESSPAYYLWKSFTNSNETTTVRGRRINFIEEGLGNFFAASIVSRSASDINIARGIFLFHPLDFKSVEKVYDALRNLKGSPEDTVYIKEIREEIINLMLGFLCGKGDTERAKKIEEDPSEQEKNIRYYVGEIIILFAYEIYKKEGKDVNTLIKDFLLFSSPQKIVEEVIQKIKEDANKEILNKAISDLKNGSKNMKEWKPRN